MHVSISRRKVKASDSAHLLQSVGVQKDPSEFNNLSRVLGHINAVLIACGCNVNDYIAVDAELGQWLRSSHIDSFAWEAMLVWRKRWPKGWTSTGARQGQVSARTAYSPFGKCENKATSENRGSTVAVNVFV